MPCILSDKICFLFFFWYNDDMKNTYEFEDIPQLEHNSQFAEPQIDTWTWNTNCKSCDVQIFGKNNRCLIFHPSWSCGTSAIQGTKILNNTRSYWEISLTERLYGTSLMFGIGTKYTRIGSNSFTNLIGEDKSSWGLSHKGLIWHGGDCSNFCRPFREGIPTTVGLLFDGIYGTLTYFKDGVCLGVAFQGLNEIKEPLYPTVSSTSAKTVMVLQSTESEIVSLQERCKAVLKRNVKPVNNFDSLQLPLKIRRYLMEGCEIDCNNENRVWYVPRF